MPADNMIWLIPILAITLGIGVIVTLILTIHRAKIRELDQRHRERMAAIDRGLDVPSDPRRPVREPLGAAAETRATHLAESGAGKPGSRYLLRGLIWLGIGLAIALVRSSPWDRGGGVFGWIAVAVGVANLIYYAVEGNRPPPPGPRPPGAPPGADNSL